MAAPPGFGRLATNVGCDPSGVADCLADINAALAAINGTGGVLLFSNGTFNVSAAITNPGGVPIMLEAGALFTGAGASSVTTGAYAWPPTQSGGGGGLSTLLDLDLTALPNQVFPTDGNYTIAGLTWQKIHSTSDTTSGVNVAFVVPLVGGSVNIFVGGNAGAGSFAAGFYVYVSDALGNQMVGLVTGNSAPPNSVTVTNLGWAGMSAPGTTINSGRLLTACPMIINGVGMQFCPQTNTNWYAADRSGIVMQLQLTQLKASVAVDTPVRLWMNTSVDGSMANYDGSLLSLDTVVDATGTYQTGMEMVRGYNGGLGYLAGVRLNSDASGQTNVGAPVQYGFNEVVAIECLNGFGGFATFYIGASYAAGWPTTQSLFSCAAGFIASINNFLGAPVNLSAQPSGGLGPGNKLVAGMGAIRANSGTLLREVVSHFRVDVG